MAFDYKKEIPLLLGKLSRTINGLTDMFHDGKDFHKINELKSIKETVDRILNLHQNRDSEIDFLRNESKRLSQEMFEQKRQMELVDLQNKNLKNQIEDQKKFMHRMVSINPQILEKISLNEMNEKFGKDVVLKIKNNKYNPYKKVA